MPTHSPWAPLKLALNLILTGSVTGRLSSEQRRFFMGMLDQLRKGRLKKVSVADSSTDSSDEQSEQIFYIPDLVEHMMQLFVSGEWEFEQPPLHPGFLNSVTDEAGKHPFASSSVLASKTRGRAQALVSSWYSLCEQHELGRRAEPGDYLKARLDLDRQLLRTQRSVLDKLEKSASIFQADEKRRGEAHQRQLEALKTEIGVVKGQSATKPDASPRPTIEHSVVTWRARAHEIGSEIAKKHPQLSLAQIAKKVHAEFIAEGITGRGGKVPAVTTILRRGLGVNGSKSK
jgi:hypothetical protein